MKRLIYFLYYLKSIDRKKFGTYINHASITTGRKKGAILFDNIMSSFLNNVSLLDYFYFKFYELSRPERLKWAGTGYLYEYQLRMNPIHYRKVLEDKIDFLTYYKPFVNRSYASLEELKKIPELTEQLLNNESGRLVLKYARGQVGAEVGVIQTYKFTAHKLLEYMQSNGYNLAEEYVAQHPDMNELSPSGLNTIRIITQINNGQVEILGARLRISVNSVVDNMAAGNLAAPIDLSTGRVTGPGVYSDITKPDESIHPVTGVRIVGFQIPFWQEVCQMAGDAAIFDTRNRSIGWDIAITQNGPELIEGNHNWCKLLWQLPVKKGLKSELEKYL